MQEFNKVIFFNFNVYYYLLLLENHIQILGILLNPILFRFCQIDHNLKFESFCFELKKQILLQIFLDYHPSTYILCDISY
jgi:hypothetical protein